MIVIPHFIKDVFKVYNYLNAIKIIYFLLQNREYVRVCGDILKARLKCLAFKLINILNTICFMCKLTWIIFAYQN